MLNFGGQQQELWCEGGEVAFITQMIAESQQFGRQVKWFTSWFLAATICRRSTVR